MASRNLRLNEEMHDRDRLRCVFYCASQTSASESQLTAHIIAILLMDIRLVSGQDTGTTLRASIILENLENLHLASKLFQFLLASPGATTLAGNLLRVRV